MSSPAFPPKRIIQKEEVDVDVSKVAVDVRTQNRDFLTPYQKSKPFAESVRVFGKSKINWPRKIATSAPKEISSGYCMNSDFNFTGTNFATQDYMSMCADPTSVKIVADVMRKQGTHSGGVPMNFGYSEHTEELVQTLEWYFDELFGTSRNHEAIGKIRRSKSGQNNRVQKAHGRVFSAGWLAGFAALQGLVQKGDFIVMDALGHNCLKEGAKASLANQVLFKHLDHNDLEKKLKEIRSKNTTNAILVVTESLFSMDSDCPDLKRTQEIAKQYNAVLVVDSAHDMFCTGERGRGHISDQVKDFSNVVILGSGSKSLSSNFGFVVTGNKNLMDLIGLQASSWSHSDALPPAVAAMVSHNIKVMGSERGFTKREELGRNATHVTKLLKKSGWETIGFASPIIIVYIGSELLSRSIAHFMYTLGVIVNSVEFPAVGNGQSRLRIQLQSNHTIAQLDDFVQKLDEVVPICEEFLETDPLSIAVTQKMIQVLMEAAKSGAKL